MIYYFDIDNTICKTEGDNYKMARPYWDRIKKINYLFDKGHNIVIITSRGQLTGINWKLLTEKQLLKWGVKYHELLFSKPYFDFFIDDKAINANYFFKEKQSVFSDVSRHNSQRTYRWDKEMW